MSDTRASTTALVGLAGLAVALYAATERSLSPIPARAFERKTEAVRLMHGCEAAILAAKKERGIAIDRKNDPDVCGLIGPQFTLITTDRGSQSAKSLAAHPNFAAAVTDMLERAGVGRGDLVAVGMTGSLPGLNLAVLSACAAIGAEPIVISSVGSSMFGATDPEMTWLDMEDVLTKRAGLRCHSSAASLGGGGDIGRGLSPQGRQLLTDAIRRNGVKLLDSESLLDAVRERVELYDRDSLLRHKKIAAYINVGGGLASLGGAPNARLIPSGLTLRLEERNYPNRGVLNIFAERGVPIIHLLEVEKLARVAGVTDDSDQPFRAGDGPLFVSYRYNLWVVCGSLLLLLGANAVVLRRDVRHRMMGRPNPERTTA